MFTAACEYIIWGTKGDTIRDKRYPKGFYSESAPAKRTHLTEKPVGVFRHLNQLARGTILDPFTGSGASVEAAILDGIPIIAGDLSPIYAQQAADRARALLGQQQAA